MNSVITIGVPGRTMENVSPGGPLRSGLIGSTSGNNATGIYTRNLYSVQLNLTRTVSMIIGIRDRFGDQAGYANCLRRVINQVKNFRVLSAGEVLRAGKSGLYGCLKIAGV